MLIVNKAAGGNEIRSRCCAKSALSQVMRKYVRLGAIGHRAVRDGALIGRQTTTHVVVYGLVTPPFASRYPDTQPAHAKN